MAIRVILGAILAEVYEDRGDKAKETANNKRNQRAVKERNVLWQWEWQIYETENLKAYITTVGIGRHLLSV